MSELNYLDNDDGEERFRAFWCGVNEIKARRAAGEPISPPEIEEYYRNLQDFTGSLPSGLTDDEILQRVEEAGLLVAPEYDDTPWDFRELN